MKLMDIRAERKRRGWTQDELSERAGIHQTTLSAIETGRVTSPSFHVVQKLATAFGFEPGIFVIDQEVA